MNASESRVPRSEIQEPRTADCSRAGSRHSPLGTLISAAGLMLVLVGGGGCATKIIDIRPYALHPDQKMETEEVLISEQHRIRTSIDYVRPAELDDAFRPPGLGRETHNPFLYRPPYAPAKFTVFRVTVRNESAHDVFGEWDKIFLRDDLGREYRPLTREALNNYWMGQVTMRLGDPITWVPQMKALERRKKTEKTLEETVYSGGFIPPRGEHTGYIVFRDVDDTGKPRIPWYQRNWWRALEFAAPVPIGYSLVNDSQHDLLRLAGGVLLGGLTLYACDYFWGPPKALPIGHLQLIFEVTSRTSRYGNPANLALMEVNFNMVKVQLPPKGDEEMDEWRAE